MTRKLIANAPMSVADAMTEFIGALHAHLYSASMTGRQKMTNNPKRGGQNRHQGRKPLSESERTVTWCAKVTESQRDKTKRLGGGAWLRRKIDEEKEE